MQDAGDAIEMFVIGGMVGAGMMYLMDPKLGRARRNYLRDKTFHIINEGRREADRFLRDKRNRAQGFLHDIRRGAERVRQAAPQMGRKVAGQQGWP